MALKLIDNIPGGIGIYNVYSDGRIELEYINDGYYSILGVTREERESYAGFSMLDAIHEADREPLLYEVKDAIAKNRQVRCEIRVLAAGDVYKWLSIRANIAERMEDRIRLFCTFADIDEMKTARLRLEESNRAMELAGNVGDISFWRYNIDKKIFYQDYYGNTPQGYDKCMENFPDCIIEAGAIEPTDLDAFCTMYKKLNQGAKNCQCTVRVKNMNTGKFEWQNIVYTRIEEESEDRFAVGYSTNVALQVANQHRYEHEAQLRQNLAKKAIVYFQMNLTTERLEEYYSKIEKDISYRIPVDIDEVRQDLLVGQVEEQFEESVQSQFQIEALKARFETGDTSFQIVYRRLVEDGSYHWVRGECEMMKRPDSKDIIAFVSVYDINKQKIDQEALDCILDEEIESVILVKPDVHRVHIVMEKEVWGNRKEGETFVSNAEFQRALLAHVIPEDYEKSAQFIQTSYMVAQLEKQDILRITYRIQGDDGKIYRKKVRAFYLNEERKIIVVARRDITDLYDEEQRQKKTLQKAIDEANAANVAKTDFLSTVSHDMRTPLNGILGVTHLMLERVTDAENRADLLQLENSGRYLLQLINDTLDVNKIESGKMALNPVVCDGRTILDNIQTLVKSNLVDKKINFQYHAESLPYSLLYLDVGRFQQVLMNIISNAIKFTPEGGTIQFQVDNIAVEHGVVMDKIVIEDSGIGMSKEFLPFLFDPFCQENQNNKTKYKGTGLGMAITKAIIELMNGEISVESELGKGTKITIVVPLPIATKEQIADAKIAKKSHVIMIKLEDKRILLCEDNTLNANIATKLLNSKGVIVEWAQDGQIGSQMFRTSKEGYYDAILMDIRMPNVDGYEATRMIRESQHPQAKSIPILAMTANAFDSDVKKSFAVGMNEHLSKPIEPTKLFQALSEQLSEVKEIQEEVSKEIDISTNQQIVLIVDDVEVNVAVLTEAVAPLYQVITATNGQEALDALQKYGDIIAVITDVQMPVMDGVELIKEIRSNQRYQYIGVLANTQFGNLEQEEALLQIGADDFIYKPTTASIVQKRLENVLRRYGI